MKLNRAYQQTELIKYSDWAEYRKWHILSDRANNVVNVQKLVNIFNGGSSVKSLFDWLIIERAIQDLKKEYEND